MGLTRYSVQIFSPENRASDVLPIEVDRETAERVAECYRRTTHLVAQVMERDQWAPAGEARSIEVPSYYPHQPPYSADDPMPWEDATWD